MGNTSSPFGQNEWLVEEMYRKFRDDPSSVDESWHEFLVDYNPDAAAEPAMAGSDGGVQPAAPADSAAKPAAAPAPPAAPPTYSASRSTSGTWPSGSLPT